MSRQWLPTSNQQTASLTTPTSPTTTATDRSTQNDRSSPLYQGSGYQPVPARAARPADLPTAHGSPATPRPATHMIAPPLQPVAGPLHEQPTLIDATTTSPTTTATDRTTPNDAISPLYQGSGYQPSQAQAAKPVDLPAAHGSPAMLRPAVG
jgi:hypothetical protein